MPTAIALVPLAAPLLVVRLLCFSGRGQRYLTSIGSKSAVAEGLEIRQMGLAFIGLVFAGLAISAGDEAGGDSVWLMLLALSAGVIGWTLSNLASVAWASIVATASLLTSLAALLAAVGGLATGNGVAAGSVLLAISPAYVVIVGYSGYFAIGHLRGGQAP